jgi:hypothetical protein
MAGPKSTKQSADRFNYEDLTTAPFIYFDVVPVHGTMGGCLQIELAARVLTPAPGGEVEVKFLTTGRLRCTKAAATNLRDAIDLGLRMLDEAERGPAAAAKLN